MLTLTGPGNSGLILYTPDGEEMVAADGKGVVHLKAFLPLEDVFVVGVIRDQRAPYSLKLAGVEPDGHFANFASWVGYSHKSASGVVETQCWLDPGRQLRATKSNGEVQIATIGRGGKTYFTGKKGDRSAAWETLRAVEGNEEVTTATYSNGRTGVQRNPLDQPFEKPNLGFVSYLC